MFVTSCIAFFTVRLLRTQLSSGKTVNIEGGEMLVILFGRSEWRKSSYVRKVATARSYERLAEPLLPLLE